MLFTHFCLPICNKSLRLESSGSVFQLSRSQRNYFLVLELCLAYCWCCKRVVKPSFFILLPTVSMIFIWSAVLSWLLPCVPARLPLKHDQWSLIHLHIYETMCSIRGIPAYNLFVRATNNPWPVHYVHTFVRSVRYPWSVFTPCGVTHKISLHYR